MRDWANIMSLWHVCDNAACRRARVCRGNARVCGPQNIQRVPDGVLHWFLELLEARKDNIPFDAAWEWLDGTPAGEAFYEWTEAAKASPGNKAANGAAPPQS